MNLHTQAQTQFPADRDFMDNWGQHAYGDGYAREYQGRNGNDAILNRSVTAGFTPFGYADDYGRMGGIDEDWATSFNRSVNDTRAFAAEASADPYKTAKFDMVQAFLYDRSGGLMDAQYWDDRVWGYSRDFPAQEIAGRNAYLRSLATYLNTQAVRSSGFVRW